ncbi:hypothetical protein BC351_34385 [Paenibacillus ferrarius]|uniref:NAD(P)-binding domain-containing protein n=1 Tax=Paenibacillus ferrarius TaxID=1469647 RepID=A0A1V4HDX5_9BACL|nr:hypothetical protein [Paenibacillus ferrarius]OPH51902.1 hypothetical protein BC351_34385 [Paenibacillus ferrarius]
MNVILGTRPLGVAVMRELLSRGESVRLVSMSGKATVPSGVRVEKADLMDKDQSKANMKQAKVVFQYAQVRGNMHESLPYTATTKRFGLVATSLESALAKTLDAQK